MIIIINGPLGIGKTEISWELLYHFERAVMLDGDYLGAVVPFEIYDEQRIEYLYQTLRHMVAYHREHGYENFVINYVFEHPDSLKRLRHLLADLDSESYVFRLICSEDEIARRIRQRNAEADQLAWELQRFRRLVDIQSQAAQRGDLGLVIDTTDLTARQAAAVIWQNIKEAITLVDYDPAWPQRYLDEKESIIAVLGDRILGIHHIGSTAVPGLSAKPVIDILIVLHRLEQAIECIAPLGKIGYTFVDYPQNMQRCFFRKGMPRSHHLHIVEQGSAEMNDHLDFRDALCADAELRQNYAQLKVDLAARYPDNRSRYSESKGEFVREALKAWRERR